jgi:hypothetical protein
MLNLNPSWRFSSPGAVGGDVREEFSVLIKKIAAQHGDRKFVFEHYKTFFADAAGRTSYVSSNLDWAESDLKAYMSDAAQNAPLFLEAFYDANLALARRYPQLVVPPITLVNHILGKNGAGYELSPPDLLSHNVSSPVEVVAEMPSLDAQAQEIIQRSLKQSEQYLSTGQARQAVQEILWLLETVSTAFQGLDVGQRTVQGKYFNKIASDLRRQHKGKTLDQVLGWMTALHGYLSSPTGGGVRHGATFDYSEMLPHEGRLFCNLIRSYINFLVAEHSRLSSNSGSDRG